MRIFVTAGNTQSPIDRVRCITNIFTGRTGANIALEAHRRGHEVTLATSHAEVLHELRGSMDLDAGRWRCEPYRTFEDLESLMSRHIGEGLPKPDAIVHCAAVSDYRTAGIFAPAASTHLDDDLNWRAALHETPALVDRSAGKVKSDEPELWLRLVRTPKLVDKIRREWSFAGILVKFKLEVGRTQEQLLVIAEHSRVQSSADWMVANTLEGAAEWAFLGTKGKYEKIPRSELSATLLGVLEKQFQESPRG